MAEGLLFPTSLSTDRAGRVPSAHLDALAEAGFYGLFSSPEDGGLGLSREEGENVIEILAGGCLTTTFVWMQHLSTAALVSRLSGRVHERWARALAAGTTRAGVAFSHLRRPDPPAVTAEAEGDGYVVDGTAPLVTGWGLVDVVHVATRTGGDVTWLLVDAAGGDTLSAVPLPLAAVNASATVSLRFSSHFVPPERLTLVQPLSEWLAQDAVSLRTNGFLALGVASRCAALGGGELAPAIAAAREALISASVEQLPAARARTSLLCLDAAASLLASCGGRGLVLTEHAQRLAREALFLLVQGQTEPIRREQVDLLTGRHD